MNIRNHLIEIHCNQRDVNDVAQALVHSVIFFRTHGKFNYKHEGSYSIGTLGFERAFCDRFDFTYVRCSSLALVTRINNKVQEFADRINENTQSGTLTLEFFQKRPSRWPFNDSKIAWEQWNIKANLTPPPPTIGQHQHSALHHHHHQHQTSSSPVPHPGASLAEGRNQPKLEELLSQKLLDIIRLVNSEKCSVPQMPTQPNLDTVFDTSFSDLQPYLYNISYKINDQLPGSQSAIGGIPGSSLGGGGAISGSGAPKSSEGGDGGTAQSSIKKFLLGTLEL